MKVAILNCDMLKDKLLLDGYNATYIEEKGSLSAYDILINPLGEYINYDVIDDVIDFYNRGGIIINLSPYAYTVPYYLDNEGIKKQNATVDVIRSFGTIDSYIPHEKECEQGVAKASYAKYQYLEKYFDGTTTYRNICHLEHNLARTDINEKNDHKDGVFVCNRLENLISLQDETGNIHCTLISKTMELGKGVIYNFNFDTSQIERGKLLKEFIDKEYNSNIYVYAEPQFSRHQTDENIELLTKVYNPNNFRGLKLRVSLYNSKGESKFEADTQIEIDCINIPCQNEQGLYKIVAEIVDGETVLDVKETGVLVVNQDTILEECQNYNRITIDKSISTEFFVQNGEVVPVHGMTYFVSDTMRRCFYHMNPFLCQKEMEVIGEHGYNIIRSGLWLNPLNIYNEDGVFRQRAIRAMQTFFYIALKNNITVQFALGHVELNEWDAETSVIHNPVTREKCKNMICNFLKMFKDYTNVQMDIVNEPSYARNSGWSIGYPSYDENERNNYIEWLKTRYNNNIKELCNNWGVIIKDFSDIELPKDGYKRLYFRTEKHINYVKLTDFFEFARESYSAWLGSIRDYARKIAPDMVVIMGIDEGLRVPAQQEEYLNGNIDMTNWHQWHQNDIVYYLLSKVPNAICCSQEQGAYKYENQRGEKTLKDTQISDLLEKKLLYSFGNFVQWQWNNDPFMSELSENNIGIIRNDGSKMPIVDRVTKLMQKEDKMTKFEKGPELSNTKIFMLYPTSKYFSTDTSMAETAVMTSIYTLVYKQKQHIYVIQEHTLKYYYSMLKAGGNLIVLPSPEVIKDEVWKLLLELVRSGNNLLITGEIENNSYWLKKSRISAIDKDMKVSPINVVEKIKIGDMSKELSFKNIIGYMYVPNVFRKCSYPNVECNTVSKFNIGEGNIYYFPLPVELSDQQEVVNYLYEYVIKDTNTQSEVFELKDKDAHGNILIYPQCFKECSVYTIVNEGADDIIRFCDLRSNKEFEVNIKSNRGVKLWIDNNGEILEFYQ